MDPFDDARQEFSTALEHAQSSLGSYRSTRHSSQDADALQWASDDLESALMALEEDMSELQLSVQTIARSGPSFFGLSQAQFEERKRFVQESRDKLQNLKNAFERESGTIAKPPSASQYPPARRRYSEDSDLEAGPSGEGADWQLQEEIIQQQDTTLDSISHVLGTLKDQAALMGHEVIEQVHMLSAFDQEVDRAQSKLSSASSRLEKFYQDNRSSKSSWCILILIIILLIMVFFLIFV